MDERPPPSSSRATRKSARRSALFTLAGLELLNARTNRAHDLELAGAAARGNAAALECIGARLACLPGLVHGLNERLGAPLSEDERDEVVQDVVTALWSRLPYFDGRGSLETWAYGFCATQMLQFLERRRRRRRLALGLDLDLEAFADPGERVRLEFDWVHGVLARLPPPADEVVRLKHFEELTFQEIGARLGLSPNTAKTHYYRALRVQLAALWRGGEE